MNFFAGSQCRGCGLVFTHKPACPYAPGPVIPPNSLIPSESFVVPLEDPNDPSADEWARLAAANADEDARDRVAKALRAIPGFDAPHEEHGYDAMCPLCRGNAEGIADALIAAGLIKGTS